MIWLYLLLGAVGKIIRIVEMSSHYSALINTWAHVHLLTAYIRAEVMNSCSSHDVLLFDEQHCVSGFHRTAVSWCVNRSSKDSSPVRLQCVFNFSEKWDVTRRSCTAVDPASAGSTCCDDCDTAGVQVCRCLWSDQSSESHSQLCQHNPLC